MATRFVINRCFSRHIKVIRNVGIIAHIDAGKTTTTEKMLFNSGTIKRAGEVDQGTTMTDYLDQERERGISITSAVATMKWKNHYINLIDTPGHVDFTLEVERALVVLDGTVTVLDAVKGVEAQTQTVWHQARNHEIPNIFYVNKFDKKDVNINLCLKSIKQKLINVFPLLIHLPFYCSKTKKFIGIMDIIEFQLECWDIENQSSNGLLIESFSRKISDSEEIFATCISARQKLLESLVDLEESDLRDQFLILDNPAIFIPAQMINDALRKATLSARVSPVLIGSSKLNIGVKNLLNKIITFLPNPSEKKISTKIFNLIENSDNLTALAFKVVHDKYKGPLTFLRLYSGFLNPGQLLQNITRSVNEKVEHIIQITGDHFVELESSSAGNIVAVSGLKNSYTGDLLIDTKFSKISEEDYSDLINIPTPVIYASIEASGLSEVKSLENALLELSKEDPSLTFKKNEETHQIIIGGMGKLHLEIIFDRIIHDYNLRNTRLGKVKIAYKECPSNDINPEVLHDHCVNEKSQGVSIKLSIRLSLQTHEDLNTKCTMKL